MGLLKFIVEQRPGEPDILSGYESRPLVFRGADILITIPAPSSGWDMDQLMSIHAEFEENIVPVDAFLDQTWIGSTEV